MRPSILYASETLYDLTETEIRQIERIEESYWRQVLKTYRSCPLSEIYLSVGQKPARFEIIKRRMLFLRHILEQKESAIIKQFFFTQFENKRKGDLVSLMLKDIKFLELNLSFQEIKHIKLSEFKNLINQRINEKALSYLLKSRRKKGIQNIYKTLQMSDYLKPNDCITSVNDKRLLFAMKNEMYLCKENTFTQVKCKCEKSVETLSHLYNCKLYNDKEHQLPFNQLYNGNLSEQKEILCTMKSVFEKRNNYMHSNEVTDVKT